MINYYILFKYNYNIYFIIIQKNNNHLILRSFLFNSLNILINKETFLNSIIPLLLYHMVIFKILIKYKYLLINIYIYFIFQETYNFLSLKLILNFSYKIMNNQNLLYKDYHFLLIYFLLLHPYVINQYYVMIKYLKELFYIFIIIK